MKGVYKFYVDCGRMGDLSGVFIADSDDVARAINNGKTVYFHDVLGKHSEIDVELSGNVISLVSDDPAVVSVVSMNDLTNGINPFDYFDMEELDEEDEEDDEEQDDEEE